jgi:hypothetical protein
MEQSLQLLFEEQGTLTPERRLLMIRATLAGIPLSRTASPDTLREAAWALEGLCVGMDNILAALETETKDHLVASVSATVRESLRQIRQELSAQLWELSESLLRARTIMLRTLVLLTEVQTAVSRRHSRVPESFHAVDVAREVVMLAVRANPTDSKWIVLVAYAEIALLALVPRERIDAEFSRKLTALRTLLTECTNYESRNLGGLPVLGAA